jgi:hypothetical protein
MGEEETGIRSKLDKLIELMEEQQLKKEKKFRLPFGMGSNRKLKKNWVIVILLRTNQNIAIKFLPIINDMIKLKDNSTYHLATTDFMWRYKKYPVMVLPEWSLKPIQPKELLEETVKNGELALPQKVVINAMELSQLKDEKKGIGGGFIIWIIVAVVAVVVVMNLMKKKV